MNMHQYYINHMYAIQISIPEIFRILQVLLKHCIYYFPKTILLFKNFHKNQFWHRGYFFLKKKTNESMHIVKKKEGGVTEQKLTFTYCSKIR